MPTWTKPYKKTGTTMRFNYQTDPRGNVTLTQEEVTSLLRAGGWTEESPEESNL